MNEGDIYLITRYGNPYEWCLSEPRKEEFARRNDMESGKYDVYRGKDAIDFLVDYIHDKHEEEEFGRHFKYAEDALKGLLEECYGIESDKQ